MAQFLLLLKCAKVLADSEGNVTPPTVASISPPDGALGVAPKTQIVITMSEAVEQTSVTSANIVLKDAMGDVVPGVFSLSPDGTVITFYPGQNLASETAYTLTVTHSVQDLQGYFMGADFTSHFTIKDTTPPPMPPAGSITASFPGPGRLRYHHRDPGQRRGGMHCAPDQRHLRRDRVRYTRARTAPSPAGSWPGSATRSRS